MNPVMEHTYSKECMYDFIKNLSSTNRFFLADLTKKVFYIYKKTNGEKARNIIFR